MKPELDLLAVLSSWVSTADGRVHFRTETFLKGLLRLSVWRFPPQLPDVSLRLSKAQLEATQRGLIAVFDSNCREKWEIKCGGNGGASPLCRGCNGVSFLPRPLGRDRSLVKTPHSLGRACACALGEGAGDKDRKEIRIVPPGPLSPHVISCSRNSKPVLLFIHFRFCSTFCK